MKEIIITVRISHNNYACKLVLELVIDPVLNKFVKKKKKTTYKMNKKR